MAVKLAYSPCLTCIVSCYIHSNQHQLPAFSVFDAPRMFIAANANCNAINAQAEVCQPQTTQSALLAKNIQKPVLRLFSLLDATSHDAKMVTAMAGH